LTDLEKEYLATIRLGIVTDTYDAEGTVLEQRAVDVTLDDVHRVLPLYTGQIDQVPPMFSAVKYQGNRLYKLARAGEQVERQPRRIHIWDMSLVSFEANVLMLRVRCSKGTYVRSLASDIGERLGCGAHLSALRRERIGTFRSDQALPLESLHDHEDIVRHLVSISDALGHLPAVRIDGNGRQRVAHGLPVFSQDVVEADQWDRTEGFVRILDQEKSCIALGTITESSGVSANQLCPKRVFI
jgi:tRNA pseudouridine55 synthase